MQPADAGAPAVLGVRGMGLLADATGDVLCAPHEQSIGGVSLRSLDPGFLRDALEPEGLRFTRPSPTNILFMSVADPLALPPA